MEARASRGAAVVLVLLVLVGLNPSHGFLVAGIDSKSPLSS